MNDTKKESNNTMSNTTKPTYKMPEDEHKTHRIKLMGLIAKGELFRARGQRGLYRRSGYNAVERCNPIDDGHVQTLIDIGFAAEDTRSVTRRLDGKDHQPIRLNPLFLGTTGNEYLGAHSYVR
jgi:hypothetical protein